MAMLKKVSLMWGHAVLYLYLCLNFTDLGSGGESVKRIETKTFVGNAAANTAKTELTTVSISEWIKSIVKSSHCVDKQCLI